MEWDGYKVKAVQDQPRRLGTQKRLERTITLTVFLSAFLFPFTLISAIAWLYFPQQFEEAKHYLQERNHAIAILIDGYFRELRNAAQLLASLPQIAEVPWLDKKGKEEVLRIYREAQAHNPNIYYIYSGYIDGTLHINDYEPPPGYDPRLRPWYRAVMDNPEPDKMVTGLLYREAKTDERILATAHILKSSTRGYTGVITLDSYTEAISQELTRRSGIYQSAESFIVDRDFTILVHPDAKWIGEKLSALLGEQPAIDPDGFFTYGSSTVRRIGYLSVIPITEWRLITTVAEEEISAPILARLTVLALTLFAFALMLTLFLGKIWRVRVLNPLLALLKHLQALASPTTTGLQTPQKHDHSDDGISQITAAIENAVVQVLLAKNAQLAESNRVISGLNQALSEQNTQLEAQAVTDLLTGIYNRRKLVAVIQEEYERFVRYQTPFTLILFDVDHFKAMNDTFGHQAGDAVLSEISHLVRSRLRTNDIFGRWGGEEFLIVVRHSRLSEAAVLAEQVRERIAAHAFPISRPVTVSLGVAEIRPEEAIDQLISRVDQALYRAKAGGRNRVERDPPASPAQ